MATEPSPRRHGKRRGSIRRVQPDETVAPDLQAQAFDDLYSDLWGVPSTADIVTRFSAATTQRRAARGAPLPAIPARDMEQYAPAPEAVLPREVLSTAHREMVDRAARKRRHDAFIQAQFGPSAAPRSSSGHRPSKSPVRRRSGWEGRSSPRRRPDAVSATNPPSLLKLSLLPEGKSPLARVNHTLVTHEDGLLLYGGRQASNSVAPYHPGVLSFVAKRNEWVELDAEMRYPPNVTPVGRRGDHTAVVFENKMVVFGGRRHSTVLDDLHSFDIPTRTWTPVVNEVTTGPGQVFCHAACVSDKASPAARMYVLGGVHQQERQHLVFAWDFRFRYWRQHRGPATVDPNQIHFAACICVGGELLVHGWREDAVLWSMDEVSGMWREMATQGFGGRTVLPPPVWQMGPACHIPSLALWCFWCTTPGSGGKDRQVWALGYHIPAKRWLKLPLQNVGSTTNPLAKEAAFVSAVTLQNYGDYERKYAASAMEADGTIAFVGGSFENDHVSFRLVPMGGPAHHPTPADFGVPSLPAGGRPGQRVSVHDAELRRRSKAGPDGDDTLPRRRGAGHGSVVVVPTRPENGLASSNERAGCPVSVLQSAQLGAWHDRLYGKRRAWLRREHRRSELAVLHADESAGGRQGRRRRARQQSVDAATRDPPVVADPPPRRGPGAVGDLLFEQHEVALRPEHRSDRRVRTALRWALLRRVVLSGGATRSDFFARSAPPPASPLPPSAPPPQRTPTMRRAAPSQARLKRTGTGLERRPSMVALGVAEVYSDGTESDDDDRPEPRGQGRRPSRRKSRRSDGDPRSDAHTARTQYVATQAAAAERARRRVGSARSAVLLPAPGVRDPRPPQSARPAGMGDLLRGEPAVSARGAQPFCLAAVAYDLPPV